MIYLDHNASNLVDPRLLEAFERGLREGWANPSSLHTPGRKARALLEEAREHVSDLVGVEPGRVTFTGSGTEALNQALRSATAPGQTIRIVASAIEHPAVLEALERLADEGLAESALIPVDDQARLDLDALERLLTPDTALLAVMAANNEVGTVQPLEQVGALAATAQVPLLVDGSQAVGRLTRDWQATPWDYLVLSSHKLRAPRGAGALIHRGRAPEPRPLLLGGSQERGRRAGTESVAAIVALGEACRLAAAGELQDPEPLAARRAALESQLQAAIPGLEVLARDAERLPNTVAFLVPSGDSEALLAGLDLAGVCASSGSACSSGALEPSHVLAAMGIAPERAQGRLRFSFGPETQTEELERAVAELAKLCVG